MYFTSLYPKRWVISKVIDVIRFASLTDELDFTRLYAILNKYSLFKYSKDKVLACAISQTACDMGLKATTRKYNGNPKSEIILYLDY